MTEIQKLMNIDWAEFCLELKNLKDDELEKVYDYAWDLYDAVGDEKDSRE